MDADITTCRERLPARLLRAEEGYQETLRRVEENDDTLKSLQIDMWDFNDKHAGRFNSNVDGVYSNLGAAIGENTHLTNLYVNLSDGIMLDVIHAGFYDGLKLNTSIHELKLSCVNNNIVCGVGKGILKAYQDNNNLTRLHIACSMRNRASLQNGGYEDIVTTLRRCTNLREIQLLECNISDEQLLPIVDAIRGRRSLEALSFRGNRIRGIGGESLATLLQDSNCNLHYLDLQSNLIDKDGLTTIANSLVKNSLCL